jgi:two-component system, OmpR family, sensor histidine kinase KdpD
VGRGRGRPVIAPLTDRGRWGDMTARMRDLRELGRGAQWLRYLQGVTLVVAATVIGEVLRREFISSNLVMIHIHLLAVVVASVYLGRGPSILVAVLSVLAFDLFFVEPRLNVAVSDPLELFTFVVLLIVALVITSLVARVREQGEAAARRAAQNAALYALSRDLAVALNMDSIVQVVIDDVSETFGRQAAVFLPEGESLKLSGASPGFVLEEGELEVALLAYRTGRESGRGTDTLPAARSRFLPLSTASGTVGVLAVQPYASGSPLSEEQRQFLDTFASQAALAITRARLAERAGEAEVLQATERLQTALLNSISHDLRTPLVSIVGALSSLQEDGEGLDLAYRRSLVDNARDEAERLNRLVGNLLDMTRIEAGALRLVCEPCDMQDLVGAAMEHLRERLANRPVALDIPSDLPLVPMDFVLMEQVLVNLMDNALKYSPPGLPIELRAWVEGSEVRVDLADSATQIPASDLVRVFDKFYRVQYPRLVSGTGLGLSICKGIVEAHGGRIWAEHRPGGGNVLRIALPLEQPGDGHQ